MKTGEMNIMNLNMLSSSMTRRGNGETRSRRVPETTVGGRLCRPCRKRTVTVGPRE